MMLSNTLIKTLIATASSAAPFEMCGLLFSDGFHQLQNSALDPEHEFLIHPDLFKLACVNHGEKAWAIVHSHPTKAGTPSVKDCQLMDALEACNQPMDMVIVGLNPIEVRCYRKVEHVYRCEWAHGRFDETVTMDSLNLSGQPPS